MNKTEVERIERDAKIAVLEHLMGTAYTLQDAVGARHFVVSRFHVRTMLETLQAKGPDTPAELAGFEVGKLYYLDDDHCLCEVINNYQYTRHWLLDDVYNKPETALLSISAGVSVQAGWKEVARDSEEALRYLGPVPRHVYKCTRCRNSQMGVPNLTHWKCQGCGKTYDIHGVAPFQHGSVPVDDEY